MKWGLLEQYRINQIRFENFVFENCYKLFYVSWVVGEVVVGRF